MNWGKFDLTLQNLYNLKMPAAQYCLPVLIHNMMYLTTY